MKFFKNYLLRTLFLVIWLWINFIYSIDLGFSCCSPNEYHDGSNEKHHPEQLSIDSKDYPEDKHHCQCKQCDIPNTKDTVLLSTHTDRLKEKKILAFKESISEIKVTLIKDLITYTNNKYPPTFHPLFLLKSSFLL
jgi:hypothetical protein